MRALGRRTLGLLALLLALAAALAACSDGGGGPDRTEGLTPQQILDQSVEAARQATSYRVSFEGEVAASLDDDALPGGLAPLLREPLDVSGEGEVTEGAARVDLSLPVSGIRLQPTVVKVGDGLYMRVLGMDFQFQTPRGAVEPVNPRLLAPSLLEWMAEPQEAGREEVGGARTVHLTGRIDPEAVIADLADLTGGGALSPDELARARRQAAQALEKDAIEVWIGTEDLLPRRIRADLDLQGELDALPGLSAARLQLTLDLSEFGAEVEIAAPPNPRPFDPGNLGLLTP